MIVEFQQLVVVNFKSFYGEHMIDFGRYSDALHFIRGENIARPRLGANGTGKSSFFADAMTWCLYGRTASGLKGTDVRPWHAKKGDRTAVSMNVLVDGKVRTITRSINPNLLHIDRRDAGQDDIDKLIRMSFAIFTNTVLLGQGRPLFYDLKPKEKMELFTEALELHRWEGWSKKASSRVSSLALTIAELEGEITGYIEALKENDAAIAETEKRAATWEAERKEREREQRELATRLQKELDAITNDMGKADLALEAAETELRHYERKLPDAEEDLLDKERVLQREEQRLRDAKAKLLAAEQELEEMGEGDKCKHCGQSLRGTSLEKHRKQLRADIKRLREEVEHGVRPSIVEAFKKADVHVRHVREMQRKFKTQAIEARDALESKTRLHAKTDAQLKEANKGLSEREAEPNPYKDTVRILKKRTKRLEDDLAQARDDLASYQRKQERAAFWIKGFKEVRLFVLDDVIAELEFATNAMLADAGLVDWQVRYEVEKENARGAISYGLQIMIESPDSNGSVRWESWSGGEAQRLRLVGSLALKEVLLNRAGVEPLLEIIDEPTRHLSPEGIDDLTEYLAERAARLRLPVFLIDHHTVESTRIASVTTIRRDNKGSRVLTPY